MTLMGFLDVYWDMSKAKQKPTSFHQGFVWAVAGIAFLAARFVYLQESFDPVIMPLWLYLPLMFLFTMAMIRFGQMGYIKWQLRGNKLLVLAAGFILLGLAGFLLTRR